MTLTARIDFDTGSRTYEFKNITELEDSLHVWTTMKILESAEIISWENLKGNPRPNQVWSVTKREWIPKK